MDIEPDKASAEASAHTISTGEMPSLSQAVEQHVSEGERADLWAAKTLQEKQDALALLVDLVGDKPVADLTKTDARAVKTSLQRLPINRNKSPLTRHLSL